MIEQTKRNSLVCPVCREEFTRKSSRQKYCPIHGYKSPLYRTWCHMKERCFKDYAREFHNYGGRGISVCPKWGKDYIEFAKWALEHDWEEGKCIDRINNDGNYSPDNCRFVPIDESSGHRRNVKKK